MDSATIAMIGERGREAVVPLSQNAEWMEPFREMRNDISALRDAYEDAARYGSGGQVTVVLEVDRHEFGRATVELGDAARQRMGVRIQPRLAY